MRVVRAPSPTYPKPLPRVLVVDGGKVPQTVYYTRLAQTVQFLHQHTPRIERRNKMPNAPETQQCLWNRSMKWRRGLQGFHFGIGPLLHQIPSCKTFYVVQTSR